MAFIRHPGSKALDGSELTIVRQIAPVNDVIALARELGPTLDTINDPAFFLSFVNSSLSLLNKGDTIKSVAGAGKLLMHASQGFAIDSEKVDVDPIEMELGKLVDIYCRASLHDIVWLGDVAVSGFAARMVDVQLYEPGEPRPTRTSHPLVVPVNSIHSYLPAA